MQFLYLIRPTRTDMLRTGLIEAESAAMSAHFAYLQSAQAEGRLILAGRTLEADERGFGIAIYNAADAIEAADFARHDPAVAAGVVQAEVYPYRVALISAENVEAGA
ncbi:YciI family protein [Chitinimonas sp. JJ19]|uniref:YciI family protein n=1 Tax=Chitinimonas sp. JJ19 TaxID=3109352 RepID=UPI0030026B27